MRYIRVIGLSEKLYRSFRIKAASANQSMSARLRHLMERDIENTSSEEIRGQASKG